jgi:precorrin-2 dehydrogenase/sirohydrochlorin ferrochelatase
MSLLIAWQLRGKTVLLVGAGDVAAARLQSVLAADAYVVVVAPSQPGIHPTIQHLIATDSRVTYHDRPFQQSDLASGSSHTSIDMVLTAIDDVETSRSIASQARALRIPVNAADIPPSCDFYFGSQIARGPLQILISTNGNSPKLANIIRTKIESQLPSNVENAILNVGTLRAKLRVRAPGVGGKLGQKRMKWMTDVCTTWDLDQLASMDDTVMEKLLDEGWNSLAVPSYASLSPTTMPTLASLLSIPKISQVIPLLGGIGIGLSTAFLIRRSLNQ